MALTRQNNQEARKTGKNLAGFFSWFFVPGFMVS
jgi:hypothetical protein